MAIAARVRPATESGSRELRRYPSRLGASPRRPPALPTSALVVLVLVVEAGQPGGQAFDRDLELRVQVDELAQPLGHPGEGDLLGAAPLGELLDPAVGEVHLWLPERLLDDGPLLGVVAVVRADRR